MKKALSFQKKYQIIFMLLVQTYLRVAQHFCLQYILRYFGLPQMDKEIPKKSNLHELAMRGPDNREISKTGPTQTVRLSNKGTF